MNIEALAIDKLAGVLERRKLIMQGEAGLVEELLDSGRTPLSHYGHSVALHLNKGSQSSPPHACKRFVILKQTCYKYTCKTFHLMFVPGQERTSWAAYSLAALYWRLKGEAYEAVECLRRALHFGLGGGADQAGPTSLVSLANVLHHSLRSEDAATVLGE